MSLSYYTFGYDHLKCKSQGVRDIHSVIHQEFIEHLLVPGTVLRAVKTAANKEDNCPTLTFSYEVIDNT